MNESGYSYRSDLRGLLTEAIYEFHKLGLQMDFSYTWGDLSRIKRELKQLQGLICRSSLHHVLGYRSSN